MTPPTLRKNLHAIIPYLIAHRMPKKLITKDTKKKHFQEQQNAATIFWREIRHTVFKSLWVHDLHLPTD
jgi:predicted membrane protein